VTELADKPFIAFGAANSAALISPVNDICTRAGFAPRVTQAVWQITTAVALAAAGLRNLVWIYLAPIRLISGVVFATMKETMGLPLPSDVRGTRCRCAPPPAPAPAARCGSDGRLDCADDCANRRMLGEAAAIE
jgi:hypothetical protein